MSPQKELRLVDIVRMVDVHRRQMENVTLKELEDNLKALNITGITSQYNRGEWRIGLYVDDRFSPSVGEDENFFKALSKAIESKAKADA